jgi:phenylalanyl-tRNA synthetase alpha chain
MLPPRPANIPSSVWGRIGRNLYQNESHPVGIISSKIHKHFNQLHNGTVFQSFPLPSSPIVTTAQAFDNLLVPKSHPLRSTSDTYYVSESTVLRPHATSHQKQILESLRSNRSGGAIWTCDVYRKDEVDRIHFPVFHQTDGVRVFPSTVSTDEIVQDLQTSLEELLGSLFHEAQIPLEMRWDYTATFPFTHPSMELEIRLPNDPRWIECLGCGKIKTQIDNNGWAFGIGIDRLAMLLFNIEDIRLLWSEDARFLSQFSANRITQFKPFSKYPPTFRDTAFWLSCDNQSFSEKDFVFNCMQLAGPYGLESVSVLDEFAKADQISRCFRFTYRGIEKTMTSDECNDVHKIVNQYISDTIGGVIR